MSPINIQVMLWIYASPARIKDHMPEISPNGLESCESALVDAGLIEECNTTESGWKATDKGEAYVDALCNMPTPVAQWTIPR